MVYINKEVIDYITVGIFAIATLVSLAILIKNFKMMIKRDLVLFFTNLIVIGYLMCRMLAFLDLVFNQKCSKWMILYASYVFLSLALALSLIEWTKVGLATQSLVIKSLSYYVNRKSFLTKALLIIIPLKFSLGFFSSILYCSKDYELTYY